MIYLQKSDRKARRSVLFSNDVLTYRDVFGKLYYNLFLRKIMIVL